MNLTLTTRSGSVKPPLPPVPERAGPRGVRLVWLELGDLEGAAPKNRNA